MWSKKLSRSAAALGIAFLVSPLPAMAWLNYPVLGNWDLDGDGIAERVYDTGSRIIIEKSTGATYSYARPANGFSSVYGQDVDGSAGAEVVFTDYYGKKIDVLKMAVGYTTYLLDNLPMVHFVDLDGVAGKEIVALSNAETFTVITHKTKTKKNYTTTVGGYSDVKFSDTDGYAGAEIVFWNNSLFTAKIVRHRNGSSKVYGLKNGWYQMTFSNQDGVVGNEVIFNSYFTGDQRLVVNDRRLTTYYIK